MNCDTPVSSLLNQALNDLTQIRQQCPIVHNITNLVVMQTTANMLLAVGASPIMAHAKEELAEILSIANALVLNIGTLDDYTLQSMVIAQTLALTQSIPIIFDPVGAGASAYRTRAAKTILESGVQILRGNASEIIALAHDHYSRHGIDTRHDTHEALSAAKSISRQYQCTVVVSGEIDIIIYQDKQYENTYGTSHFTKVTGMGCSATAIIGAFAAINKDYFSSACHAMTLFTLAGQHAASGSQGPASFYQHLVDQLYKLDKNTIV